MGNNLKRKLNLSRETIRPLTPDSLEDVNGGNAISAVSRSAVKLSQQYCSKVAKSIWKGIETIGISWGSYQATKSIANSTKE
jgi:hypothetical protein